MNQDINNQVNYDNTMNQFNNVYDATNVVPQQETQYNEVPVQETPVEAVTSEVPAEQAQPGEIKKSKIIVLDEDPVKFEVPEVASDVPTEPTYQEAPAPEVQEEPKEQTGAIQF